MARVPITGSRATMAPQAPVRTTTETSRDAERIISQPPAPFANEYGIAKLPTGRLDMSTLGQPYGQASDVNARPQSGGKNVGCQNTSLNDDQMAAIGYKPDATRSTNPIISGFPTGRRRK